MNFQAVEQANGNKVMIFGTFVEVGGVQYTPQQKAKAICKIRDATGVSHNVHIYQGTGELPIPENLNQRYQFSLSSFEGNYQGKPYTGYSGFWNSNAQVAPKTQQQAPQNVQQPPSRAPQQANALIDARNTSIERQAAFEAACEYCGKRGLDENVIIKVAIAGHYFIQTGKNPDDIPEPDPSITEPPTGDDIPF